MMEPFLPRLLKRSGIIYSRIGEDIKYHGMRGTYHASLASTVETIVPNLKDLYNHILDELTVQPVNNDDHPL